MTDTPKPSIFLADARLVATFPNPPADSACNATLYSPAYLRVWDQEWIAAQGGAVVPYPGESPQQDELLGDPRRFADRISLWVNGEYQGEIINARSFPWELSPASVTADRDRVGSVSSIQLFILPNGEIHALVTASISDPNVTTGVHGDKPNIFGSETTPWSYFVKYHFKLEARGGWGKTNFVLQPANWPEDSQALAAACLYYKPSAEEASQNFQGLVGVRSAIVDQDGGWIYCLDEFRRTTDGFSEGGGGQTQFLVRTQLSAPFRKWEILFDGKWFAFDGGQLPSRVNAPDTKTGDKPGEHWHEGVNPIDHIGTHVTVQHNLPGKFVFASCPSRNGVLLATADHIEGPWIAQPDVIGLAGLGDGSANSLIDAHFYEDPAGKPHVLAGSRIAGCGGDGYAAFEIWCASVETAGTLPSPAPGPIVPPVDPPVVVVPPTATPKYNTPTKGTVPTDAAMKALGYPAGTHKYGSFASLHWGNGAPATGLWWLAMPPGFVFAALTPSPDGTAWEEVGTVADTGTTPPVTPPVTPPATGLPFAYDDVHGVGTLDETVLTTARGYTLGDTWYTGPLGWIIKRKGGPAPTPSTDWLRRNEVTR